MVINSQPMVINRAKELEIAKDLRFYSPATLSNSPVGLISRLILGKYMGLDDEIRWALKPPFIRYLTEQHLPICYCDCDLCFYSDYQFIIDKLRREQSTRGKSIIITPHFREIRRIKNDEWRYNYKHGLYNAGFMGFGDGCQTMLDWWSEMCATECTKDETAWTYVDQKYLDVVPIYFYPDVEVLIHYGCNVAGWNTHYLIRSLDKDGKVKVADKEIVFIHYSPATITGIEGGHDHLLSDHFKSYEEAIQEVRKMLVSAHLRNCISGAVEGRQI
jgi:hypothetical protein